MFLASSALTNPSPGIRVGFLPSLVLSLARGQSEGWLPQAFWTLHRLARCHRSLELSPGEEGRTGDGGGSRGAYVSTVMRLAAALKDPRVRSEGGTAAVEHAATALLRDARSFAGVADTGAGAGAPEESSGRGSSTSPERAPKPASKQASYSSSVGDDSPAGDGGGGKHVYRLRCFADANLSVVNANDAKGGAATAAAAAGGGKGRRGRRPDPFPAVHIGDPLYVSCVLTSHLPEAVTLDSLVLEMTLDGGGGGQHPAEGSAMGGRHGSVGGEQSSHRRSSPKRSKSLRRLESVRTVAGGDKGPSTGSGAVGRLQRPLATDMFASAPGIPSQALLPTGAAGRGGAAESVGATPGKAGETSGFQVPAIRTTRSQSLSPRASLASASSAADVKESLAGGDKAPPSMPSKPPRVGGGSGSSSRSRSPPRLSIGSSPPPSPFPSAPATRRPRAHRAPPRPVCTARIEGPVELLPGDTEVVFTVHPTVAGVITASRVSASWGGVTLTEVLSGGGRGRGTSGVSLPSAWVGVPRPPPSAVVRPFLPRVVLEVVPPSFLPIGDEGWLRVTVEPGPDTLRGARLRVTAGRGLAWGGAEASRVRWRATGDGAGDDPGPTNAAPGAGQPAQAQAGEDPADVLVDLEEVLRPGGSAEVFLRVRSTAEAAAVEARAAFAPRSCFVQAELQAWHSRHREGYAGSGGGGADDDWGVKCSTHARAGLTPKLPFETRVSVTPRPGGVVFAQAALVCTAPVALSLRSCELSRLEAGAEILSDPNGFLNGEVLPPGQPLRLAACLRRPPAAAAAADGVPLAVHKLTYAIEPAAAGGGEGSQPAELFVFEVSIPSPSDGKGSASRGSSRAAGVTARRSLTTTVRPCGGGGGGDGSVGAADNGVLHLRLAEPRAFEFGIADGGGGPSDDVAAAGRTVNYQVVASPSDWMVSGLIRGTAKLELKVRVHSRLRRFLYSLGNPGGLEALLFSHRLGQFFAV